MDARPAKRLRRPTSSVELAISCPAALGSTAHNDERSLLRHIARLDETLSELGDNLRSR
jgi:hypothetical protein